MWGSDTKYKNPCMNTRLELRHAESLKLHAVEMCLYNLLLCPIVICVMSQPCCCPLGRSGVSCSLQLHPLPNYVLWRNALTGNHHPEEAGVVVDL
jgi:hypothetical protein